MSTRPQFDGFLTSLFDTSFANFITTRLIRVLYILGLLLMGLAALVVLIGALSQGFGSFILALIVAPLLFLLGVMYLRVMLEILIVIFRIAENVQRIADRSHVVAEP